MLDIFIKEKAATLSPQADKSARTMPRPGDRMGAYRLLFELGQGGMASVFAAEPLVGPLQGTRVACKILLPHLRRDERSLAQFAAEARTTASIRHPNVVSVLDVPSDSNAGYFVTEFCDGLPLDKLLMANGRLPTPVACELLAQLAAGLHAAHTTLSDTKQPLNIVHRDISPHNVHVGWDGCVKLLDFGIAAAEGNARLTRTGDLKGKLAYLSPEQITRGHNVDAKTDLWAFGVVAYETLSGRCLFAAVNEATTLWNVTAMDVPSLAQIVPGIPPALAQVIEACLHREPSQRPADADAIAKILRAHTDATSISAVRELLKKHRRANDAGELKTKQPARTFPWIAVAATAGMALLLGAPSTSGTIAARTAAPPTHANPQVPLAVPAPTTVQAKPAQQAIEPKNARATKPRLLKNKERNPALVSNPYHDLVSNPY